MSRRNSKDLPSPGTAREAKQQARGTGDDHKRAKIEREQKRIERRDQQWVIITANIFERKAEGQYINRYAEKASIMSKMRMVHKKWKKLESQYVIDSKHLRIRRDKVEIPDGQVCDDYYVNERPGWVTAFCVTNEGFVIMNRQYKYGIGEVVLELPAGGIDHSDESPAAAMERELLEETGYRVASLEHLATLIIDPTGCTGRIWVFLGRGAQKVTEPREDPMEKIEVILKRPEEIIPLIRDGSINVMGQVAAIYLALDHLNPQSRSPAPGQD